MRRIAVALSIVLSFILTPIARADLKVGDAAPELKISKWVKGGPVKLAEGMGKKVYVVEFWATWCGPCRATIPHLTKLAQRFEKKDVVFVGVSIDDARTRDKVEPFVKDQDKKMDYVVALDDADATNDAYMEAAGVQGIPHAFLVDKAGKIAWHGHPMDGLGEKIADLVGDADFAKAEREHRSVQEKLQSAFRGEKWDDAIACLDKLAVIEPENLEYSLYKYHILAIKKKDAEGAKKFGQGVVEKTGDAQFLNAISWLILTNDDFEGNRDLKLALAAAKKANDVTKGEDWAILDTLARALFDTGDAQGAVEAQKKVLSLAKKAGAEDDQLTELKGSLERYSKKPGAKEEKKDEKKEEGKKEDK